MPPPPIVEVPAEAPAAADAAPAGDPSATPASPTPAPKAAPAEPGLFDDPAAIVGLITAGGGILGGLTVGSLVFLSPICCALPFGLPCGAVSMGGAALLGAAMMSGWDWRRVWSPPLFATLIGSVAGLVASIAGLTTASVMGMAFGTPSIDPTRFAGTVTLTAGAAGLVTAVIMIAGGVGAGLAAAFAYGFEEQGGEGAAAAARARPQPAAPVAMAY